MKAVQIATAVVLCVGASAAAWAGEASPVSFRTPTAGCRADAASRAVTTAWSATGQARTAPRAGLRPAAQVTRNEKADVTFEVRPAADGGTQVTATSSGVQVTKTVQATGEFVLQLKAGSDTVSIAVNGRGTTVNRGRQRVDLPRNVDAPGRRPAARRLLAESDAVVRARGVADALMMANDRSPAAMGLILADAVLGVLSGDVGAPRCIAEFMARGGAKKLRPAGMAIDCFTLMEQRMVEAWNDYVSCWMSVGSLIFSDYLQEACALRWVVQAESYWFSFISCTGFNF